MPPLSLENFRSHIKSVGILQKEKFIKNIKKQKITNIDWKINATQTKNPENAIFAHWDFLFENGYLNRVKMSEGSVK